MLCGNASWVAGLLCACIVMLGPMGHPVEDAQMGSTFATKHYVSQSRWMPAAEQEFVLKRKQVALKSLNKLGIPCELDSVPHVALLGSAGGQMAAVGLVGSLYQMEKEGLLDTVLYLGGSSGSAWSMACLYRDPQWSANMDRAVTRLSGPGVGAEEAVAWLRKKAKEEHFSATDMWGVITSAGIMKQLDLQHLSEEGMNTFNPYPIYNAVNRDCLQHGPEKGKWFEISPHEAGFTDLGLFINTSHLGDRIHQTDPEEPQQTNTFWDAFHSYIRKKPTQLISNDTGDPPVLSWLDKQQKTVKDSLNAIPNVSFGKKLILEHWRQNLLAPLQTWSQSLNEGSIKNNVSWLIQKAFTLIGKWEWGSMKNFLYQHPGTEVPTCIRHKEHLQLVDTGVMLNMPYPPFLGEKRDTDLLIALNYGADDTFKTLTFARDYAATVRKPFPEIDVKILEEKDWPKDCYVFEGKDLEPTIIYMPLFNRRNCKDAKELKAKMVEFSTLQRPFSQKKSHFVLETAKANMKNNKETLLREMNKAVHRRHTGV